MRTATMKTAGVALGAALGLAFAADDARAQAPGAELQLVPRVGAYAPLSDLRDADGEFVSPAKLEGGFALGLALELDLPASPFGLRGTLDYVTETTVSGTGFTPSEDGGRLLALTGDVVFRPLPRLILVQPYLVGGAGVKVYDFGLDQVAAGSYYENRNDFTWHAGAGVDVTLGQFAIVAEIGDYISRFEPVEGADAKTQHDIFIMAGLRLGLF